MVRRIIETIVLTQHGENAYGFAFGEHEYRLRMEDGIWVLDQSRRHEVDSRVPGRSVECESFADAMHYAMEAPLSDCLV